MGLKPVLANEATAAQRRVYFHLVDATDGISAETGEAGSQPQISTNGGAWTDTGIGTLSAIGNGRYYADLTQAAVGSAGDHIETRFKSAATAETPGDSVLVVAYDPFAATDLGLTNLDATVSSRATPAQVNTEVDTALADVNLDHFVGTATGIPAVPAGTFLDQMLDDGTATYDRTTDSLQAIADSGGGGPTAAQIADAVWDEATGDHVTSGSFGQRLASIRAGTAQAGAAGSITLDASASGTDDFYNNALLAITGGTGANQARFLEDYTGSSKVATVSPNWVTTPDNTSVFVIIPFDDIPGASAPSAASIADAVWDEAVADHVGAGSTGERVERLDIIASGGAGGLTNARATNLDNADVTVSSRMAEASINTTGGAVDTVTTNTDMRGTDNAALASVLGAVADAAAAGDPTATDTVIAYLKQIINTLEGTAGIPAFPAEASPGNNVSLAETIRAIHTDVTGLNGDAMRGTDNAALASVATEARLAELDAANIPTDLSNIEADTQDIQGRLPAALVGGRIDANMGAISGDVGAADKAEEAFNAVVTFTVGSGSSATAIVLSASNPTLSVDDQVNGKVLTFDEATATTALRGQSAVITDYTDATSTLNVAAAALTTAPASGDTGVIT